jgi:hypothetical protein
VEDRVEATAGEEPVQEGAIADVPGRRRDARFGLGGRDIRRHDLRDVTAGERAAFQKLAQQVPPDEARRAGDENPQRCARSACLPMVL